MFERSLLIDDTVARKTRAFTAIILAQIAMTGVLILIPLLYHDVLPTIRLLTAIAAPIPHAKLPVAAGVVRPRPPALWAPVPYDAFSGFTPKSPGPIQATMDPAAIYGDAPLLTDASGIATGGPNTLVHLQELPAPPPPPPSIEKPPPGPVRVSAGVQAAKILRRVLPIYPPIAVQARVSGTVHLLGVIGKDGAIRQLQILGGHPLLIQPAIDAVRQWIYRPTLLNGEPVEVVAPIDVIFNLR